MSRSVGFGVIGANSFVANAAVLPAIVSTGNARLVATASRSGEVAEPWRSTAVDSYDAVLEHPDVEAVYIPLPNGMHLEWTEKAAAAGKNVLCEKPLAPDSVTARHMADACEQAGVLLAEAWMTPFHERYREILRRARSGEIGDIVAVDGSFRFTIGPEAADNYRWDPEQGGGALLDVGIYCLGAIVELFGSNPTTITARQQRRGGVDASTAAVLEWPDGRRGTISCSFVDDEFQHLAIDGTAGRLAIDTEAFTGGEGDTAYVHDTHPPSHLAAAPSPLATPPRVVTIESGGNDSYRSMIDSFARAIRGEVEWPRPVERSIEMLALIERIKEVARD